MPQSKEILNRIDNADTEAKYEHLLNDLADKFLNSKTMEYYETQEKIGTIYDCDGKFRFIEAFYDDYDYEDDYEDDCEDDEDEEKNDPEILMLEKILAEKRARRKQQQDEM